MTTPAQNKRSRKLAALVLACCAHSALSAGLVQAQPPGVSLHAVAALVGRDALPVRVPVPVAAKKTTQGRPDKRAKAPVDPGQLTPLPTAFERLGGAHVKRAMQVAQGVPAGRVALRPMFWMTRDQRGGMVALGGRF
jgi:hypothetical protein